MANEPGQLDRLTLLRSGGEIQAPWIDAKFNGKAGEASIKTALELRKVKSVGGKETIRTALAVKEGETKFNVRSTKDFRERFGAGKGTAASTPAEKASYMKAEQVLRDSAKIALYLELKSLPISEHAKLLTDPSIIAELGGGALNYPHIRDSALGLIAASDAVNSLFPELRIQSGALTQVDKTFFLEKTLFPADDARFAGRFGSRMRDAYKKAADFEVVMTDEKRAEMEEQKRTEVAKLDQRVTKIIGLLTSRGLTKAGGGAIFDADVKNWLNTIAFTPDTAGDAIASQVLGVSLESVSEMRRYSIELPQQKTKLESILTPKLGGVTLPVYLADAAHAGESEVIALKNIAAENVTLDAKYAAGNPLRPDLDRFNGSGVAALYLDGSLVKLSSEAKTSSNTIEDVSARIIARPATSADIDKSHDKRILQEEDLLGELDGILGQSIADVLEERYDVMEERMGRLMQEKADKSDQDVKINIMNIKKKMSENWIKYNATSRKKEVNKDQIKKDVTHLTYSFDKDVALKQLIARDAFGLGVDFDKLNVIDGTKMPPPTPPAVPTQLLNAEQLKQMEGVFKEVGTEYRDKLFTDMFAARSFGDRLNGGKLKFTRDEWKYMMQRYDPDITKALNANHDAHQAMQTLEAQGVKMSFSLKWLLYILLGLGAGVGAVALAPVAGIAGIAAVGANLTTLGAGLGGGGVGLAASRLVPNRHTTDVNGNVS